MKLDLSNFAFELSVGKYQNCSLGDALAKEFAIQSVGQIVLTREQAKAEKQLRTV